MISMIKWLKNAVIYQIMVDRFSTGNSRKDRKLENKTSKSWMGGNLKGILTHIEHISNFANVLYLSPVYSASEYHGYAVKDYFKIDPHFGREKDLIKLVRASHERNIKVILDFVPNHMSWENPIFVEAKRNRNSKYFKWFVFEKWPNEYLCYLNVKELPKINVDNEDAREYLISAAKYWIEIAEIDGYRLDHSIGPSKDFWKEFNREIKSIKKDFALIGEAGHALGWYVGSKFKKEWKKEWIKTLWFIKSFSLKERKEVEEIAEKRDLFSSIEYTDLMMKNSQEIFDGCIDFSFGDLAIALATGKIKEEEFKKNLEKHYKKFRKDFSLITLLSNHDRGRFVSYFGKEKTIEISSLQFSIYQPALIYYGEEIGLKGKGPFENARRFMIWNKKLWDKELLEHYKALYKSRS